MVEYRICILIPYFGRWPDYFSNFLKSCQANPGVDIVFFTDLDLPEWYPKNVFFEKLSMAGFCALASVKLGLKIRFKNPYKLCDFRPAFGLIFDEYLESYDFWGHGDIDVIYGDIRKFFTDELLASYDIISARKEWLSGGLCIFRNVNTVRHLFSDEPSYESILLDERHYCFDETRFQWRRYRQAQDIAAQKDLKPSMTLTAKMAAKENRIRLHMKTLVKEEMRWSDLVWIDSGRVFDRQREYLFYHFVCDKHRLTFVLPDWEEVPDRYFICKAGFYTESEHQKGRLWLSLLRRLKSLHPKK